MCKFVEIIQAMHLYPGRSFGNLLKTVILLFSCILTPCMQNHASVSPRKYRTPVVFPADLFSLLINGDTPMGNFQSITIPLKRAGRLFLIEARIDDQEGNLIFDTGATELVLNRTYFRKYAAREKPTGGGVTGTTNKVSRISVKRLQISDLYYENLRADLCDLGHIENRRGVKILGLFGLNMITGFEVVFDARNSQLQLNRVDRNGNRLNPAPSGIKYDFTQNMETMNSILVLKGKIGEKFLSFVLDTGAETNVINKHSSKNVLRTIQITHRTSLGGVDAANVEVLSGTMNDFKLGNHQLGPMETIVTDLDAMSESYGRTIDGMLGFEFWQKGIFCINFNKNEMSFSLGKGVNK